MSNFQLLASIMIAARGCHISCLRDNLFAEVGPLCYAYMCQCLRLGLNYNKTVHKSIRNLASGTLGDYFPCLGCSCQAYPFVGRRMHVDNGRLSSLVGGQHIRADSFYRSQ